MSKKNLFAETPHVPDKHDWIDQFELENGYHQHKCSECGADYIGHKRNFNCRDCSYLNLCTNARRDASRIEHIKTQCELLEEIASDLVRVKYGSKLWLHTCDKLLDYYTDKNEEKQGDF